MAIEKEVTTETGVVVSYWRVTRMNLNIASDMVEYVIGGYVSKDTRLAGRQPVKEYSNCIYEVKDFEAMNRAAVYEHAKTDECFAGGKDV